MLVPMQKLTLYALKADRDALLLALQKDGSVMLEPGSGNQGPARIRKSQRPAG